MKYITERSDANLPEPVSCPPEFPSISDKKEEGTATECRGGDAIPHRAIQQQTAHAAHFSIQGC